MNRNVLSALLWIPLICLIWSTGAGAQTDPAAASKQAPAEEPAAAPPAGTSELLAETDELAQTIERLVAELASAEGEEKSLVIDQLARSKEAYRKHLSELVEDLQGATQGGAAAEARERVVQLVESESKVLRDDLEAVRDELKELRTQAEPASGEERLKLEQRIAALAAVVDQLLREYAAQTVRMATLELDASADEQYLDELLQSRAQSLASRIELVMQEIENQGAALAQATEDEKPAIEAELKALQAKESANAESLKATVAVMGERGLDAAAYSQLLISATGEITGDILDTDVAMGLVQQWTEQAGDWALENGPGLLVKVIVVVLILLVFKILAAMVGRLVRKGVSTAKIDLSKLLQEFFVNIATKAVMVVGILVALSQLGVQVGPLLAGLGVVGFIVGFALQDSLSNFAAGLMVLIYRPYDVGDFIEAGGVMGKVDQMNVVSTTILTPDNQKLVVPNNKIWGGVIRNVTAQVSRRVDMTFGIGYGDDIARAERVLKEIVEGHELVLKDPAPVIKLHTLGESSVDFVVRPWAKTSDYWDVYWDITRSVKERFDAEGISIPFPQRDVHLIQEPAAS